MPLGLTSVGDPRVWHYRFVLPLAKNVGFYAFEVSDGTVDCNAFPGDETSWLGIAVKLLAPFA